MNPTARWQQWASRLRRDGEVDATFFRRSAVVAAVSTVVFVWMITLGRWDLLQGGVFSGMLDVQARSMMRGHFWVPDGSLGFEGFVVDGRTYAYFGVFPSMLRMPVFAVTDQFDGRLTMVSMLAAYLLALVGSIRLLAGVHRLVRGDEGWSTAGGWLAVGTVAAVGLGSNLFYLASGAWVYHEATLWGAAGVLQAFAAIVAWLRRPAGRSLVAAGAWTTVAWLSRGSVGLAPSVALGLLGLAVLVDHRALRALAPTPPRLRRGLRAAVPLFVAAAVGGLAFASVNMAKFGSPTELPMDKQLQSIDPVPSRAAALEAYDGTIFSNRLIPSVLVQTLRPDLLRPSGTWPFLQYTNVAPPGLAAPVFDTVEPSSGLTLSHPLLAALAVVGVVAACRRRPGSDHRRDNGTDTTEFDGSAVSGAAALRPLLLGSVLATVPVLTIAFISQRYVTDFLPFVLVAAFIGVGVIDRWLAERPSGAAPRAVLGILGSLMVVGTAVTVGTTWLYQRLSIPPDVEARAAGIRTQAAVGRVIGHGPRFERSASIHDTKATGGTLLVVGDCAGLYIGQDDGVWSPIEVTGAARVPRVGVTGHPRVGAAPVELLTSGTTRVELVTVRQGTVRVDIDTYGGRTVRGKPFKAPNHFELSVDLDGSLTDIQVLHEGRGVTFDPSPPPDDPIRFGTGDATVQVRELTVPTPTCDALTDD